MAESNRRWADNSSVSPATLDSSHFTGFLNGGLIKPRACARNLEIICKLCEPPPVLLPKAELQQLIALVLRNRIEIASYSQHTIVTIGLKSKEPDGSPESDATIN